MDDEHKNAHVFHVLASCVGGNDEFENFALDILERVEEELERMEIDPPKSLIDAMVKMRNNGINNSE